MVRALDGGQLRFRRKGIFRAFWAVQRWLGFPSTGFAGDFFPSRLEFSRVSDTDTPVAAHRSGSKSTTSARDHDVSGMAPFPHDARATLADRGEHVQHGGADLQENLPAVAHDLARGLKQPPAHGLHLRTLPSASNTGKQLESNYFTQTLLPDYMEEND